MSKKGVTPGSVKTVSDNEHGNVYHDENGLMTSPENGVSSDVEELGGDFDLTDEGEFADLELDFDLTDEGEFAELDLDFELENEGPIGGLSDDEILEKIEEVKTVLNNDALVSNIASLDLETKITALSEVYSEELLAQASEQEIELLSLLNSLKIQKNENLQEQVSLEKFDFPGIWKGQIVTVKNYLEKKDTIELKRKFYQEQLSLIDSNDTYSKQILESRLESLNFFEEIGKKYEILRDNYVSLSSINLEEYKEFSDKFIDQTSAYSQTRKDNAIWFNTGNIPQNIDLSLKEFGPKFQKMWESMSPQEKMALKGYTGSYHKINEPLRNIKYVGNPSFPSGNFIQTINDMTSAIDKCTWENDIWAQRGIDLDTNFIRGVHEKVGKSIINMTDEELNALIGTTFEDQGFASAGVAKGTGFDWKPIILNTYCPKGTKMAYMNTVGSYSGGSENEMILQRGYSYKITKIEVKRNTWGSIQKCYIDCEVILGSDENKWNDEEMYNILMEKNPHFLK